MDELEKLVRLYSLTKGVPQIYIGVTQTLDPAYQSASLQLLHEIRDMLEVGMSERHPILLGPAGRPISEARSLPVPKAEPEVDEGLKHKFETLVEQWKAETRFVSTVHEMVMQPAYLQIIGMGPVAVPLILKKLAAEPDHWFWALRSITGEDPVPEESRGKLGEMSKAWLEWGKRQGYEW